MRIFILFCILLMSGLNAPPASAASDPVYTSWRNNLAVQGYDTVSFFSGKPIVGRAEFSETYKGAVWHFSSQANLDLFKTNPEAFAPQFGGYCAWAVAKDKLAKGAAKHWHVEDGKLYLNFNKRIKAKWDKDRVAFISQAQDYWPLILED